MNRQSEIRNPKSAIVIVGGGPAGSSLAIRLAHSGFETTLIEKERFPRQKLCGEFISPECMPHFADLGVLDSMMAAGGERITETRFFETGGRSVSVPSSWFGDAGAFALGLSRAEMDLRLLERAKETGVEVYEGTTISDLRFDGKKAARIVGQTDDGREIEIDADIFVDATGRAGTLARLAEGKQTARTKPRIVGFKSHITDVDLEPGVCEIYSFPGGYAGLSHVENKRANICFLIRSEVVRSVGSDARTLAEAVVMKNRRASETLRNFEAGDWLAVSISGFGTKQVSPASNLFSVGDAAAFIDPFTGSGMVMALESASILADAIGKCPGSLDRISAEYRDAYGRRFATRLRVCSILRRTAFMPRLATAVVASLGVSTPARRFLARLTRG